MLANAPDTPTSVELVEYQIKKKEECFFVNCIFKIYNTGAPVVILGYSGSKGSSLHLMPNKDYVLRVFKDGKWSSIFFHPPGSYDSTNAKLVLKKGGSGFVEVDFILEGVSFSIDCKVVFSLTVKGRRNVVSFESRSFTLK